MQIQDGATRLHQLPLLLGTGRQPIPQELFVFMHEMPELSFLCRQSVEFLDVEFAKLFNVDGSTVSVGSVVELGIVLVDIGLFGVVEPVPLQVSACVLISKLPRSM